MILTRQGSSDRRHAHRWFPRFCLLLGALALMLAGCGQVSSAAPPDQTPTSIPLGSPSPAASQQSVYLSTQDGSILALNAVNGTLLWRSQTAGKLPALALADGTLYAASSALYAFSAADGRLHWQRPAGGPTQAPIVTNGVVYVISDAIYAFNASDGSARWRAALPVTLYSLQAVTDGAVYVNTAAGLYALNATDGSVSWKPAMGGFARVLGITATSLYALIQGETPGITSNTRLVSLNTSDGSVRWRFPSGNSPYGALGVIGVDQDVVYVSANTSLGSLYNVVIALNASDGSTRWQAQITDPTFTLPTLANGVIYLGSQDGFLTTLNASDGSTGWHVPVMSSSSSVTPTPTTGATPTPTTVGQDVNVLGVSAGLVYASLASADIYAMNASDGSPRWYFQAGEQVEVWGTTNGDSYASIWRNGKSDQGAVFALDSSTGTLLWRYPITQAFSPPIVS